MRRHGLGWQLGVAFALVAIATALIAAATLSIVWRAQFDRYVRQNVQDNADGLALTIGRIYALSNSWHGVPLGEIVGSAAMNGLRVQVRDGTGAIIADSGLGLSRLMGGPMEQATPDLPDNLAADGRVVVDGRQIGLVKVWSLSAARDVQFRQASLEALMLAGVIAVLLATAAGAGYARSIVRPINRVTAAAAALRAGERDARTGMAGEDPVGVLGRTLDEMADSIEADREFERRLTADVAHELRTPLQAIQATVEAMQDGVLPADGERLETVRNETRRLARLTDSILDLSRLERGGVPLRMEPVDLAVPLLTALDAHRALVESAGLTLEESVANGLVVSGDVDRLTQAFGNLISNAARYTSAGGHVRVALAREGDEAVVRVSDNGVGIAGADLDNVFVRFWRADEARSRATGGLGIGLAVVKEIVERHNGTVGVTSTVGVGTEFAVRLRLERPAAKGDPRRS